MIDVKNSSSPAATAFTDLTLLSNDIPAVKRREDELELRISDEDEDVFGQPVILVYYLPFCYCYNVIQRF